LSLFAPQTPLAEQMRPRKLEEFVGQRHLLKEGKFLHRLWRSKFLPSLILWGPAGCGKTTLARLLAGHFHFNFEAFSAVESGVKEVRQVVQEARIRLQRGEGGTILFVDEIHRFNKGQQDAFLPHLEKGLLTLIGTTTENPSFSLISPLLSRSKVLVLSPLSDQELLEVLKQALEDPDRGLGQAPPVVESGVLEAMVQHSDGDARVALNLLESVFQLSPEDSGGVKTLKLSVLSDILSGKRPLYDRAGEEHYNLISAFHKSLRGSDPDASLYWLTRMLASGEDPLYVARRMIRFASEDVGNADPRALLVALGAFQAYHTLGSPEGELALAQAALYLAAAPKSIAAYQAFESCKKDLSAQKSYPVPLHLRNAPTRLMKNLGYGQGYLYPPDHEEDAPDQEYFPPELKGKVYYHPQNLGFEAVLKARLKRWKEKKKNRKQ
jgi:putative ATPase